MAHGLQIRAIRLPLPSDLEIKYRMTDITDKYKNSNPSKKLNAINSIFIMEEIIIIIRRLLVLLILITSISCKSQVQDNVENKYSLTVNEVQLDKHILELLKNTKLNFNNKFKKQPQVIILEFYNTNNRLLMTVENRSSLYLDREEFLILNDNFIGGAILDSSLVLIKNNNALDINFIHIKSNKVKFDLEYNNSMDFWKGKYRISKKDITLIDEYWSYEIFTD